MTSPWFVGMTGQQIGEDRMRARYLVTSARTKDNMCTRALARVEMSTDLGIRLLAVLEWDDPADR